MIPVIEMFASIQGEGKYAGVPTIFIRVSGCNLRCVFKDSICDTPYSSFHPEKGMFNDMDEFVNRFKALSDSYSNIYHVCITGGEPMLYAADIEKFTNIVSEKKQYLFTIETNGTLSYSKCYYQDMPFVYAVPYSFFSISPKLSTSVDKECKFISKEMADKHDKTRHNPDAIADIIEASYKEFATSESCDIPTIDFQLKFVYSDENTMLEIEKLLNEYAKCAAKRFVNDRHFPQVNERTIYDYIQSHVYIMPEGITNDQLNTKRKEAIDVCMTKGWNYTDRLHIVVWGDKRGV